VDATDKPLHSCPLCVYFYLLFVQLYQGYYNIKMYVAIWYTIAVHLKYTRTF